MFSGANTDLIGVIRGYVGDLECWTNLSATESASKSRHTIRA